MLKGFALGPTQTSDGGTVYIGPTEYHWLAQSSAQVVRLDLDCWNQKKITTYQGILTQLTSAGLTVIGLLGSGLVQGATQAQWNEQNTENGGAGSNPWLYDYANAAQACVQNYGQWVTHWEIFNEPNGATQQTGPTTWTGGSFMYPSLYAALLQMVYPQTKQAQPHSVVITGGLLAHCIRGVYSRHNAACDYLQSLYDNGMAGFYDAIAYHPYIDQGGPLGAEHLQRYLTWIHEVVAWNVQAPDIPLYVTESGQQSARVTPAVQAQSLTDGFRVYRDNAQVVAAACNFTLRDNPGSGMSYGVIDGAWNPKPSLSAFKQN